MNAIDHERVRFATASPFVLTDLGGRPGTNTLVAEFYTPAGIAPPWPGAVVSEGLGGLKNARERRYGRFLAANGFATLVVDSFAARGFENAAHPVRAINVTESMMLADAFAALSWLSAREDVDGKQIGHVGFSYGGMIAILTAYEQLRRLFVDTGRRFCAHVSYYGPTIPRLEDYRTTGAPLAILNGALDRNLDPKRLDLIAGDLRNGGSAVENVVFPNAYHQWDSDDVERRFDRFNLSRMRTRIDPANRILDEHTGRAIRGFSTRLLAIARAVSLKGFHPMRDEDVMRTTDAILLRFLGRRISPPAA